MPIVINNSTGLAENLDKDTAESGLRSNQYSLPFVSPEGKTVSIPFDQAQQALSSNHRQLDPGELDALMRYGKAASTEGQLKAGATAFLKGATLGISPVVQTKLGISTPQELQDLAEANPGITTAGEMTGLIASSLVAPEFGAGKLMTQAGKAGEMVATAAGATAATGMGRAAITAGRMAAETALYQTGDEISKQLVYEPEKSVAQSVIDVGLSGLMGAATGVGFVGAKTAVSPLWRAAKESKLAETLGAIKARFDGASFMDDVDQIAAKAGIDLTPEIRARLSKDPMIKNMAREMSERANTKATRQFQGSLEEYKEKFNNAVLSAIGKTEADVGVKASTESVGSKTRNFLSDFFGKRTQAMREKFKPVYELIEKQAFPEEQIAKMSDDLTQKAIEQRWHEVKGQGQMREIKDAIKSFRNVKTFKDFDEISRAIVTNLKKKKLFDVADVVYSVSRAYEESSERLALEMAQLPHLKKMAAIAPEEVQKVVGMHSAARAEYKGIMDEIRDISKRLGISRYATSPEEFIKALNKTDLKLLGDRAMQERSEMFSVLSKYPELSKIVQQGHLDKIQLKKDANGLFNVKDFFNSVAKMTPEKRDFVLNKEAQERLGALQELFERMGKTKEVRQLDKILEFMPGGAAALASLLVSGNPVHALMYFGVGQATKKALTEIPDAMRMSMLKMLASDQPISGKGFKSMFDFAQSVYNGAKKGEQAISNMFKPGVPVLSSSMAPSAKSLGILERTVFSAQTRPEQLFDKEDDLSYYLPEHSMHMSALSGRAVTYLDSLRPKSSKLGPLDMEAPPSAAETAKYKRALSIAEQPLVVLQSVKDGTLTLQDVISISTIYPSLYDEMKVKILDNISKGVEIPYKMKTSLSLFMGQPMESSTIPANININQAINVPTPPKAPSVGFKSSFSKMSNIYATPGQLRERQKGNR